MKLKKIKEVKKKNQLKAQVGHLFNLRNKINHKKQKNRPKKLKNKK